MNLGVLVAGLKFKKPRLTLIGLVGAASTSTAIFLIYNNLGNLTTTIIIGAVVLAFIGTAALMSRKNL